MSKVREEVFMIRFNTFRLVDEVVLATESLNVKESEPAVEEVSTKESAPVSNAPMSWAARMRSNTGQPLLPSSQMPPLPASTAAQAPKPVKVEPAKVVTPAPSIAPSAEAADEIVEPTPAASSSQGQRPNMNNQQTREFNLQRPGNNRRFDDRENQPDRPVRYQNDDRHQIFVGGLPSSMTDENIRSVFARFGTIKYVRMNQNTNSRPGAGFGFVTFSSEGEAQAALNARDDIFFNNLQLNIEEKKTKNPDHRTNQSGGSDRGSHRGGPHSGRGRGDHSGRGDDRGGRGGGRGGQGGGYRDNRPGQGGHRGGGPPTGGPRDNYQRDNRPGNNRYNNK